MHAHTFISKQGVTDPKYQSFLIIQVRSPHVDGFLLHADHPFIDVGQFVCGFFMVNLVPE
jgi:hypothetical protein